jgi:hypothetical protein
MVDHDRGCRGHRQDLIADRSCRAARRRQCLPRPRSSLPAMRIAGAPIRSACLTTVLVVAAYLQRPIAGDRRCNRSLLIASAWFIVLMIRWRPTPMRPPIAVELTDQEREALADTSDIERGDGAERSGPTVALDDNAPPPPGERDRLPLGATPIPHSHSVLFVESVPDRGSPTRAPQRSLYRVRSRTTVRSARPPTGRAPPLRRAARCPHARHRRVGGR